MIRVAYLSTYVPKRCGIATYTLHLRQAVNSAKNWKGKDKVIVVTNAGEEIRYSDPLLLPLVRDRQEEYIQMARRINQTDVDLVSLQHEFGIFGGEAGSYILEFVRNLKKPLITTFHTVFEHPEPPYAAIQKEIAERSRKIIVMNRKAIVYLNRSFGIPIEKIVFIPHGSPVPDNEKREEYREQLGWSGRKVMMTFGLLNRGKGIELIIKTLPKIVKQIPNVLYAVVGQTHPEVKRWEGEKYREELSALIRSQGLKNHVVMIDRYLEEEELVQHLIACDLYLTPYPGMQQITSGTLAYAVGLGRPVLSTPYSYAQDLLSGYPELLIPYSNEAVWAEKIVSMFGSDQVIKDWERKMDDLGKTMRWPQIGEQHAKLFAEVKEHACVLS
jgi:glycosyltransferase involved in cell wall biosynthesis